MKDSIVAAIGGGCAAIDYNRDGRMDLLLVRGSTLPRLKQGGDPVVALYENRGDGTFVDVGAKAGLTTRGWGMGVVAADYDNDGWTDFLVTGLTRNYLFHNKPGAAENARVSGRSGGGAGPARAFEEVAREAGVAREGVWSSGAAFGDLDGDGRLDLYIAAYVSAGLDALPRRGGGVNCIYKGVDVFCGPRGMKPASGALFHNEGSRFRDISSESGIAAAAPPFFSLQPLIADFDGDGRADIFVANDSTPSYLYHNEGGLKFTESGIASGLAVNMDGRAQAAMGADFADFDGDNLPDLIVTVFSEDTNTLHRNLGRGAFEDASWASKLGPPSWLFLGWGVKFLDFDLDGWQDVMIANGHVYPEADRFQGGSAYRQRILLHRNLGKGSFAEIGGSDPALAAPLTARGLAAADFDNDGDVDVVINNQDGGPRFLRNDVASLGRWMEITLTGSESNRDGVGATVTARAAGRRWTRVRLAGDSYLSSSDPRLHFGLGAVERLDELVIRWPSGREQSLGGVTTNRLIQVEEPRPR
jgi:hypothetical protein